ncbi:MAG: V-type ATPase 116kDa subunit family protein [archaeon]
MRMCRVQIVGSKGVLQGVIEDLHSMKLLHLEEYSAGKYDEDCFDIGAPFGKASTTSEKLVKVRVVINFLGIGKKEFKKDVLGSNSWERFKAIEKAVLGLHEKKKGLEAAVKANNSKRGEKKEKTNLEGVNKSMKKVVDTYGAFLYNYEKELKAETEKAEAPLRFAVSTNAFIVDGWVPEKDYKKVEKILEDRTGGKVHMEQLEDCIDAPPTELQNPGGIESFEFFLKLYSLPSYKELDPTMFVFITFPLFFGFMLGDVGYGIATFIAFYLAGRKMSGASKGFVNAMMIASVGAIIFGFVFGEFFGASMGYTPLLHRAGEHQDQIMLMIMISVLIGALHITSGFVLNAVNGFKAHGVKGAVLEGGSWLLLELGAIMLIVQNQGWFAAPYLFEAGAGVIVLSIIMIYMGHGVAGLIELPSVLSNILSYARLFAIGLASVILAVIINDSVGNMIQMGWMWWPLAGIILVLGHALNIAIGLLGGFLQSLRLHYVEFFTKFYKGGGKKYEPFGA